jgi:DNA-binding LytR/AlgR family response regulator
MKPVTALIAEDEAPQRLALQGQLLEAWPELEIVAVCEDGLSALDAVAVRRPSVAFLDIRMPGVSGLDVAKAVVENGGLVVFTTAYDDYAIRAFETGAVDYLLKPVQPARLAHTVERHRKHIELGKVGTQPAHRRFELW